MTEEGIDWLGDLEEEIKSRMPSDEKVETLTKLAEIYTDLTEMTATAEETLKRLQENLRVVREEIIPDKMMEFGIKKLVLTDGSELSYSPFYRGTVIGEGAYDWLENEGYPDAVKQEIKVEGSRARAAYLTMVRDFVKNMDAELSIKEKLSVHHMTLGALIKELSKKGKSLPPDLFNVYIGNIASLKKGKPQ